MTDKTPKLLVDAPDAIESAQEFVAGCTLHGYCIDKMRRSAVERQLEIASFESMESCENHAAVLPHHST